MLGEYFCSIIDSQQLFKLILWHLLSAIARGKALDWLDLFLNSVWLLLYYMIWIKGNSWQNFVFCATVTSILSVRIIKVHLNCEIENWAISKRTECRMQQNETKSKKKIVWKNKHTHTHTHCCIGYQMCKTQEMENGEAKSDNAMSPLQEIISSHWAAQKLVPLTTRDF